MSTPQAAEFPRISLVLLSWNQERFVDAAVQSCLAQDCPPIEIVLSDDDSTDGTYERLTQAAAAYRGPHRVTVRRNSRNLGIGMHYNALLDATQGDLIVTAAGDDISLPNRVRRIGEAWNANGRSADLITSHAIDLDTDGRQHATLRVDDLSAWRGMDDWLRHRPHVIGATHAFTRRLMRHFGPMSPGIAYEDQVMAFRAINLGGAITIDAPLVCYRRGGLSARPPEGQTEALERWKHRQLAPILAEMLQLIADARVVGHSAPLETRFRQPIAFHTFKLALEGSRNLADRCRALRATPDLPFWWRVRKVLHATFPNLRRLRRRHWRARKEQLSANASN